MNYPIYRTKAALRFSLSRNCSAFIEGAPAIAGRQGQMQKGERKYDWQNQKIAMSVSPEELLAIAAACESLRIKGTCPLPPLYHDPKVGNYNGVPKQFKIEPYTNQRSKTQFIAIANLSEMGDTKRQLAIGLTYANLFAIELFCSKASSIILGWDTVQAQKVNQEKDNTLPPQKQEEEIIDDGEDDIPF